MNKKESSAPLNTINIYTYYAASTELQITLWKFTSISTSVQINVPFLTEVHVIFNSCLLWLHSRASATSKCTFGDLRLQHSRYTIYFFYSFQLKGKTAVQFNMWITSIQWLSNNVVQVIKRRVIKILNM